MAYLLRPDDSGADLAQFGGKAHALAVLHGAGLPIPEWTVVVPAAFLASLTGDQRRAMAAAADGQDPDGAGVRAALAGLHPGPEVLAELAEAVAGLCPDGAPVAVRSSAADEDSAQFSFAGQLDSYLFVGAPDVPARVAAVWRSGFSARTFAYRREHGLSPLPPPPAVLIQRMVPAEVAGVAFSADPVSGRRGVAVVGAVYGLGTALVSGAADADTYRVDPEGRVIERTVAATRIMHRAAPGSGEGVEAVQVPPELAGAPVLADGQVRAVAALARQAERHFSRPQDIEWAMAGGRTYLLQSRPITALADLADPDGECAVWDNSNIAESYGGVTTPLTFSFARRAYEEVYRQFCRILLVPRATIAGSGDTFRRMLGLVRGRIYYNLLNWYRVLAMLPGFAVNRRFMEQMMGVRESLPDSIAADLARTTWRDRLVDGLRLATAIGGLVLSYFTLPRRIRGFYGRLAAVLGEIRPDLGGLRADELAAYYRSLERQLLTRWDAPLVNDFFAMIFHGVLRRLTGRWCGDAEGTLSNDLLLGGGGMISAEPPAHLRAMAALAARDPALVKLLATGSPRAIAAALEGAPDLRDRVADYLDRFGDRCLDELKLESPSLHDDPLPLFRSVGRLATAGEAVAGGLRPGGGEPDLHRRAEQQVRQALARRPLRRCLFGWVLQGARARVRDRENLRFERTRVFGRVRMIFVELGRRLYAADLLDDPRDVFYLEVEEALGVVHGTASSTDLRGLAAVRRAEFERYRRMEPPPDRFETRGIVHRGNLLPSAARAAPQGDRLQGTGCCPGVVRGPVRVVADPQHGGLQAGEILVAERTDPGWIMLFAAAAGLLVERGSLLSHSAIVSREMGIPSIVGLSGVTHWLRSGDWVELDGSTGVVVKVAAPAEVAAHG